MSQNNHTKSDDELFVFFKPYEGVNIDDLDDAYFEAAVLASDSIQKSQA
jgi:hypothetical protein